MLYQNKPRFININDLIHSFIIKGIGETSGAIRVQILGMLPL